MGKGDGKAPKHAKPAGGKHAAPKDPKAPRGKPQPRGFPHDKNSGKGDNGDSGATGAAAGNDRWG